jgi:hypothetical protein
MRGTIMKRRRKDVISRIESGRTAMATILIERSML